jgi:hypothetical protein
VELEKNILGQLLGGRAVCQKVLRDAEDHGLVTTHEIRKIGPGGVLRVVCGVVLWHGQGL